MAYTKVKPLMVTSFPSSRLTGAFGAISGANLTGLGDGIDTKSASNDPAVDTNPSGGVGHVWLNKTSGEMFICTDSTAGENVWTNIGEGSGDIEPFLYPGTISGFSAGSDPITNVIERFSFTSDGNSVDHGDLTNGRAASGGSSSTTHGYVSGGYIGAGTDMTHGNVVDKFQFNTNSNSTDVGDLTVARGNVGGHTSTTHGYAVGGTTTGYAAATTNIIEKWSFSVNANATDVGDLTVAKHNICNINSQTHGYTAGGTWNGTPAPYTNVIDKFSFITDGNATDVGDVPVTMAGSAGHSTASHGYIAGGVWTGTGYHTRIERFSFASGGNSVEYGADLHTGVGSAADQTSTTHGYVSGNATNTTNQIQKYSFSSNANGTDVGDLIAARFYNAGTHY